MKTTYITKTWTENTAGGSMVDFVQLDSGHVIAVNDEALTVWPSLAAFWDDTGSQCQLSHWFKKDDLVDYSTPINSPADAEGFLFQLHQAGKLFHPDDNPATVIRSTGEPLFTPTEAALVAQRMDEVFEQLDDPSDYALTLTNPETDRN